MKYLTIFVMSMTVFLFAACSSDEINPTVSPEEIETKPAMETAVPTEIPAPTDKPYPEADAPNSDVAPAQESVESYPGAAPTIAAINPYPDQESEPVSEIVPDSAYPAAEASQPIRPGDATAITEQINQALADRLGIDSSEITVVSVEAVEWGDSSLGCPAPGYVYAQVITPGYQIMLEANSQSYDYHADLNGNFVLCGEDGMPIE